MEVGLAHSTREVAEQSSAGGGGGDGGKGRGQGECDRGQHAPDAEPQKACPPTLDRIREAAQRDKRLRFTALHHHLTFDLLRWSFFQLKRKAAAGADGVTWDQYEAGPARTRTRGRIPVKAVAAAIHSQAGRPTTAARHRGAGGQDRPTGGDGGAEAPAVAASIVCDAPAINPNKTKDAAARPPRRRSR